jgi:hypothetical protein
VTKAASAREKKFARLPAGGLQVVIDGLRGLELDWPSRLLLPYCCTVHCIAVWGNVIDLDRDDIATAKLAIDSQVKQGEVTYSPLHEQSGSSGRRCDALEFHGAWTASAVFGRMSLSESIITNDDSGRNLRPWLLNHDSAKSG